MCLRWKLSLVLIPIIMCLWISMAFAQPIVEWDIPIEDITINPLVSLNNVELHVAQFRVISDSMYDVTVSVQPRFGWQNVVMNSTNIPRTQTDYAAAFDVAITDRYGIWQGLRTGGNNVIHLVNQPATPTWRAHKIVIALVLVDQENLSILSEASLKTSGIPGISRFKEFPSSWYSTGIEVNVISRP